MTLPRDWLPTDWLSVLTDLVGFVGFGLTIYVFQTARVIKRQYQRRLLLPSLVAEFEQVYKDVASELDTRRCTKVEAKRRMDKIAVRAREIKPLVSKGRQKYIVRLIVQIENFKADQSLKNINEAYTSAALVYEELASEVKSNSWE